MSDMSGNSIRNIINTLNFKEENKWFQNIDVIGKRVPPSCEKTKTTAKNDYCFNHSLFLFSFLFSTLS